MAVRMNLAAVVLLGMLAPAPAPPSAPQGDAPGSASKRTAATHATRGVVQALSGTVLVLSRPRNRGDITFRLTGTTRRDGTIAVGATVSVRYRDEGGNHVATAVAVQRPEG